MNIENFNKSPKGGYRGPTSYGRTELALLYNPHLTPQSAWRTLQHWIVVCKPLHARLQQMGYDPSHRRFTPAQVAEIVAHLGEP